MEVYVTSDFVVGGPNREESMGAVVRIDKLEEGFGVAIHFLPAIWTLVRYQWPDSGTFAEAGRRVA